MTKIKCAADCLYVVDGFCVNEKIELSFRDNGHMMCEMQFEQQISGQEEGFNHKFSPKDISEIYQGLTPDEVNTLLNNSKANAAMSDDRRKFLIELVTELEKKEMDE